MSNFQSSDLALSTDLATAKTMETTRGPQTSPQKSGVCKTSLQTVENEFELLDNPAKSTDVECPNVTPKRTTRLMYGEVI